MPKVSVIIPVYNVEKYLRQCLDSVVNQTLKDIEIICVDDGATDNSGIILDEYAAKDNRVKIIHKQNEGAGNARNTGLNYATGDYIAFLDSDDVYDIHMLEKLYCHAFTYNLDVVICRSQQLNQPTQSILESPWTIKADQLPNKKIFNYQDIPQYIITFCIGWPWDKLFKRVLIENYKIRFPQIHNSEDAMFVFTALCLAKRISVINDILVTHRINIPTQLSAMRNAYPFDFIEGALILKQCLETNSVYNSVEQSFINWFVTHSYWHLDTLNIKEAYLLEKKLSSVFEKLGVFNHDKSYFFDEETYIKLKLMISNLPYDFYKLSGQNHVLQNNHWILLKYIRYKICEILTFGKKHNYYQNKASILKRSMKL